MRISPISNHTISLKGKSAFPSKADFAGKMVSETVNEATILSIGIINNINMIRHFSDNWINSMAHKIFNTAYQFNLEPEKVQLAVKDIVNNNYDSMRKCEVITGYYLHPYFTVTRAISNIGQEIISRCETIQKELKNNKTIDEVVDKYIKQNQESKS